MTDPARKATTNARIPLRRCRSLGANDARISDLEPKFALGLRRKAAGECLDGRFQTYCASRARTLMTERAVHLPPRPEGNPRSLSALAVAFALSPGIFGENLVELPSASVGVISSDGILRLSQAGKASPSLPIPAIVSNATALRGIGLQLFGFDWSSKRA